MGLSKKKKNDNKLDPVVKKSINLNGKVKHVDLNIKSLNGQAIDLSIIQPNVNLLQYQTAMESSKRERNHMAVQANEDIMSMIKSDT